MIDRKEYAAWLATLSAGDQVVLQGRIGKIARVTPTQFVLPGANGTEVRVNRDDGCVRGRRYRQIEPLTQEVRDKIEHDRLHAWINIVPACSVNNWKKPPLAVLRAMKAAYDAEMAKLKGATS